MKNHDQNVHKSPGHAMAQLQLHQAFGNYIQVLDQIGQANADFQRENGEPACCMTCLMMEVAMTHLVNLFVRVNDENVQDMHDALLKALNEAPTMAAQAEAVMTDQTVGSA